MFMVQQPQLLKSLTVKKETFMAKRRTKKKNANLLTAIVAIAFAAVAYANAK